MRRSLPSSFSLAVGTLWVALKDKVCVATAGSDNQTWRAQTGPWVGTERPDRIVLQAFGCMFSSSFSRLLHFFSLSLSFSLTLLTLSLSSHLPLSSVSCSTSEWRADVALWTYASLTLNRSLIYQPGRSCSAMTGLNYRAWICFKTASPNSRFPCTVCVCVCVCVCVRW